MLLVTGCSGPSANYFFQALSSANYKAKIKCIIRSTSNINHLKKYNLNLEFLNGDMNDDSFLENAFRNIKIVLHIANIKFSSKIVSIGSKLDVEWFICVHTTAIFSKHKKLSGKYNEIESKLLKNYKNITILRPSLIYGTGEDIFTGGDKKRDRKIWKIINFINRYRFFIIFGDGNNLMQPVHCKDLGEAYYLVLNNKINTIGKQYNLPGQDQISYKHMLKIISKQLGKKTLFLKVPIWMSRFFLKFLNKLFFKTFFFQDEQILRLTEDRVFSFIEAKTDFSYNPMKFEEGIKKEIKMYLKS